MLTTPIRQRGVNIIELMVVISIVAIVMAIGVPQLQSWIATSRVSVKAQAVLNGLQLARAEALRRNARVAFTLAVDSSWSIGCVTFVADNDGDGLVDCPAIIQSKSADEGGTVSITLAGGATTATFTGLGLTAPNADGSATLSRADFSTTGTTQTYRVLLTTGGQSRLCDPAVVTAGSPNLC